MTKKKSLPSVSQLYFPKADPKAVVALVEKMRIDAVTERKAYAIKRALETLDILRKRYMHMDEDNVTFDAQGMIKDKAFSKQRLEQRLELERINGALVDAIDMALAGRDDDLANALDVAERYKINIIKDSVNLSGSCSSYVTRSYGAMTLNGNTATLSG